MHRFSSDVHQFSSRGNVPVIAANLWRRDDVLMTFDGGQLFCTL